jgi:hypothetical protein
MSTPSDPSKPRRTPLPAPVDTTTYDSIRSSHTGSSSAPGDSPFYEFFSKFPRFKPRSASSDGLETEELDKKQLDDRTSLLELGLPCSRSLIRSSIQRRASIWRRHQGRLCVCLTGLLPYSFQSRKARLCVLLCTKQLRTYFTCSKQALR